MGFIKVILTTNFDRLMEQALTEEAVQYQVISTPDAAEGVLPMVHASCTVIKLHGDYHDIRIKNTEDELLEYDPRIQTLLDRVFDEYGLVIGGWSGQWDTALVASLKRCKSHRFMTAWLEVSELSPLAKGLADLRRATIIQGSDADTFFSDLESKIKSLEQFDSPTEISSQLAVATLKRYLRDPKHVIKLHDLVQTETKKAISKVNSFDLPMNLYVTKELVADRIQKYDSAISILLPIVIYGSYWEKDNLDLWTQAIARLTGFNSRGANDSLLGLRRYPAFILFQAEGIAAVAKKNWEFLFELLKSTQINIDGKSMNATKALASYEVFQDGVTSFLPITGPAIVAVSRIVRAKISGVFDQILVSPREFDQATDRFEYINGLVYADICDCGYGPVGEFILREAAIGHPPIFKELDNEIVAKGERHPLVRSRIFSSVDRLIEVKKDYDAHALKLMARR
ncbi:MAG: SIR2 family protein [Pseudobdellovibrionaceae bacterium]